MGEVIDSYLTLMNELLQGRASGDEFQDKYFNLFKKDDREIGDKEFRVLDWLFAEVDDYVPDPELRRRAGGLNDEELLDRVNQVKARLLDLT